MHRLGNLTLTGYNPELSNSPFPAKREKLAQSNVQMNKEIARGEEEWGFGQVEERGQRLAEKAIRLWMAGPRPAPTTRDGTESSALSNRRQPGRAGRVVFRYAGRRLDGKGAARRACEFDPLDAHDSPLPCGPPWAESR